jgi:hypothetical protein
MTKKPNESRDPTDASHPLYDPTLDPTHRFYLGSKTEGEQKPDAPDADAYKVGPGYPPKQHTWRPGQSPNPTTPKETAPARGRAQTIGSQNGN